MQPTMGALFSFSSFVLGVSVLSLAIDAPLVLSLRIDIPVSLNTPVSVKVRIEGWKSTIFEGEVLTFGHNVTTASSNETHHCDGTNNGANAVPGATATTALDDASRLGGFTWDANYTAEADDFSITRIRYNNQSSKDFINWSLFVNYDFIRAPGGCQRRVSASDDVLWVYNAVRNTYFLKLSGSDLAIVDKPFNLTVTDGVTKKPLEGATIEGKETDANGNVTITVSTVGVYKFKAERENSSRSNSFEVFVLPGPNRLDLS